MYFLLTILLRYKELKMKDFRNMSPFIKSHFTDQFSHETRHQFVASKQYKSSSHIVMDQLSGE